jgi:MarC family membrane protein
MSAAFGSMLQLWLVALSSIFFLVDPLGAIPTFLAIAGNAQPRRQRHLARRASLTCFVVLTTFAFLGRYIFKALGFTLPAFEIAGGIILLLIGIETLQAKRSSTQETPGEAEEGAHKEDAGVIPLGIPMLAGPGAISAVMVLVGPAHTLKGMLPVIVAIVATCIASYLILAGAMRVAKLLGQTGINILVRFMGLLLTAIAIQFMINGLTHLGVLRSL